MVRLGIDFINISTLLIRISTNVILRHAGNESGLSFLITIICDGYGFSILWLL